MASRRIALSLGVLLVLAPASARAQDSACAWDACSLRIHSSLFSTTVVRGLAGERVAKLGSFSPRIDVLEHAPDSTVRFAYRDFVHASNTATGFTLAGFVTGVAAFAAYASHGSFHSAAPWLLGTSAAFSITQMTFQKQAMDRLELAVWRYNRGLPRP